MRMIFYDERQRRASVWPRAMWHFFWMTWKYRHQYQPPMTVIECIIAAKRSMHLWVWGRMELDEYLILKKRQI